MVENDGLILADGHGATCRVAYPDAAIWDLISRSYDFGKTVWMMRYIAGLDDESSRHLVCDALDRWTTAGFLTRKEQHG